jgi:flagellar hook-associated protein 2
MSSVASTTTVPTTTASTANSAAANALISSQGIGSGLDIAGIVTALTTSEGAAETNALNSRKTALSAQVSAFGTFSSALSTLQATLTTLSDPTKLAGRTATLADTTIATASATSTAVAASYTLQVQNLATAASLSSQPVASSAMVVGTGTLTIGVGGASTSIVIDSSNNTLDGIVAAINSAANNPGVSASILTTTAGARLVISGTVTGASNGITVSQTGGDGGLATLAYPPNGLIGLSETQPAKDANFTINGYPATDSSNQISGVVSGVTLNLLAPTATGASTTLTVGNDTAGTQTSISTFIKALNGVLTSIQSLTSYDPSTQTAGPLLGNQTLLSFQNQLSKILSSVNASANGGPQSLTDLGITANPQGIYDTNSTTLSNTLGSSFSAVASLLSGANGIATQLNTLVANYTQPGGLIDSITTGLQSGLTDVAKQQTALTARLATYSATLTAEYNAMDTAVALLKQTQTYLTAEFNYGSTNSNTSTSTSTGLGSGTLSTGG